MKLMNLGNLIGFFRRLKTKEHRQIMENQNPGFLYQTKTKHGLDQHCQIGCFKVSATMVWHYFIPYKVMKKKKKKMKIQLMIFLL